MQILGLYNEDGEINISRGSEVEEFGGNKQSSVYILLCIGLILVSILVTIFIIYKKD
jgi:hypothetical protein